MTPIPDATIKVEYNNAWIPGLKRSAPGSRMPNSPLRDSLPDDQKTKNRMTSCNS
jgi:hypothetical protein